MKLQLQPMFIPTRITWKPKLYDAMYHASLHLLFEAKQGK